MSPDSSTIQEHVLAAVHSLGDDLEMDFLQNADAQTPLIGIRSDVDSITLVNIIVDVEERLATELDLDVVIADERAMSQRRSPFRSVRTLVEYICELQTQNQQA